MIHVIEESVVTILERVINFVAQSTQEQMLTKAKVTVIIAAVGEQRESYR